MISSGSLRTTLAPCREAVESALRAAVEAAAAGPAAQPWTIGLSSNRESRDAESYAVRSDGDQRTAG